MSETPRALLSVLITILIVIITGGAVDIWLDGPKAWLTVHTAVELLMVLFSAGCLVYLWREWRESEADARSVRDALARSERTLAERQAERDHWRANAEQALSGMTRAIDAQFTLWGLTATEREVAYLLLRGLGHKQIAAQTGRSERTVRQHAVTIYGKAGVVGRAELAGYFLTE